MMSYPTMAGHIRAYLTEIDAVNRVTQQGIFHGGAVLRLSDNHLMAVLLPSVDPDIAHVNCLAYMQDMDLIGWDITSEHTFGTGADSLTVLHLSPPMSDVA